MRIAFPLKLTLCAAAMTVVAAGTVLAADPEPPSGAAEVRVSPAEAAPGDEVELRVRGCAGASATAGSEGFVAEAVLAPATGGELFGEARVRSTLEPGGYPVEVECAGTSLTGQLTVVAAAPPGGQPRPTAEERPERPAPAHPTGPVGAGGGGTAGESSPAGASVPTGPAGLTLLAGGLLACGVVFLVRRLRGARR
ncbi:hypothetical protein E1265_13050 [Streptomyces sp. 8K308]|uniref:hypothetical protein n=1 Tax=Streptomyces sp. 8K308 TaxID=2530388 RepID=UPI001044F6E9|nr:hypothetical protein [Streptomyces sp. 8K308]TDC23321.1 hypothetical protein E1265_13050 [Streptomyces sp. 8K308]